MIPQFSDDDYSQTKKAVDVLRTGNQTLGIEILTELIAKKDQIAANAGDERVGGPNQQMIPQHRESKKEPKEMPHAGEYQELEDQGSQYQEASQYSAREIEDFVRLVSQRDTERDQQMNELREAFVQQGQALESQAQYLLNREKQIALRECSSLLRLRLQESKLPRETQTLIATEFANRVFKESALIQTIDRHRRHVTHLAESFMRASGQETMPGHYPGHNGLQFRESGGRSVQMGRSSLEVIQAEFDRAFGYDPSLDNSLSESAKDVYRSLPRTPSIKRPMGHWHGDMEYNFDGMIGQNAMLREAASTDVGLANLLQNSMTKSVMQRFMLLPAEYREVAEIVPVNNFLTHQVIVTGGLGILPRVLESKTGVSYLTLGFPSNFQTTYSVGTFGGLIPVTRQAIINDNLQEIQEYPKRAAESAMMTLNMYVFGTLIGYYGTSATAAINTAVSYDSIAYYHANHLNVTSSAMSYSSLVDMQNRLFEQRTFGNTTTLHANVSIGDTTFETTADVNDFISGLKAGDTVQIDAERIKVSSVNTSTNVVTTTTAFTAAHTAGPDTKLVFQLSSPIAFNKRTLIVPTQLGHTAYQLLASTLEPGTTTNSASALNPAYKEGSLRLMQLHSMYLQDDLTNYYMAAGKPIRWGFLGGRETPEVLLQDNPLVGNVFSGDLISWKVRHEHGGCLLSHLMVQAGIV